MCHFPSMVDQIKAIDIFQVLCLVGYVPSVDIHFLTYDADTVRVNFGDLNVWLNLSPVFGDKVVNIYFVAVDSSDSLSSEKNEILLVLDTCMAFQFDLFSIAEIVVGLPDKLFTIF